MPITISDKAIFIPSNSYEFCSFDMDLQSNGSATLHGCNPSNTVRRLGSSGVSVASVRAVAYHYTKCL